MLPKWSSDIDGAGARGHINDQRVHQTHHLLKRIVGWLSQPPCQYLEYATGDKWDRQFNGQPRIGLWAGMSSLAREALKFLPHRIRSTSVQ